MDVGALRLTGRALLTAGCCQDGASGVRRVVTLWEISRCVASRFIRTLADLWRRSCGADVAGWLNATVPVTARLRNSRAAPRCARRFFSGTTASSLRGARRDVDTLAGARRFARLDDRRDTSPRR